MRTAAALLAATFAAAGAAPPAAGQEAAPQITAEGARAIAEDLKVYVEETFPPQMPPGFALAMEVSVEPAGNHYFLAMKDVRFDAAGLGRFEVGTITSRLVPLGGGRFDTDSRLPGRMELQPLGTPPLVIAVDDQDLRGVFDPAIWTFSEFDMRLDGLRVFAPGQPEGLAIESYLVSGGARGIGEQRFDYGMVAEVLGLRMDDPRMRLSLDRGWMDFQLGGLSFDEYLRFYEDYAEIMTAGTRPDGTLKPEGLLELANLFDRTGTVFGSFDYEVGMTGLEVAEAGEAVTLDEVIVRFAGGPFDARLSSLRFGVTIGPMSMTAGPPILPEGMEIDIAALDLPTGPLRQGMVAAMRADALGSTTQAEEAGQAILDALVAADSRLSLDSLAIRLPNSRLDASGELRVEPGALFGATGDGQVELRGLNALTAQLSADDEAAPLIAALTLLQTISRPETASDGAQVRRLDLRFDEQGQVLVNGADIAPLLEGLD